MFDSPEELHVWKEVFEEAIAEGLGDDSVSVLMIIPFYNDLDLN